MAAADAAGAITSAKCAAYLNGSYHSDREAVLDRRHRTMMFTVVVLGTSAIIKPFGDGLDIYFGAASALVGAIDLTFNFSVRARNHSYLRKEYFRIAASLAEGKIGAKTAEARMTELAAEEEPIFMAALAIAHNWATRAVYGAEMPLPCKVGWLRRQMRHLFKMTHVDFTSAG